MLDLLDSSDPIQQPVRAAQLQECCNHCQCATAACTTMQCLLLRNVGRLKTFNKDDVIFWDGEKSNCIYLIVSGVVRGTKLLCDGRRQVTRFVFSGELLEYGYLPQMPFTAEAITSVTTRAVPRQVLDNAMNERPCLRQLVMQSILDELHETQCLVTALARLTAQERVAQFLHNISMRSGTNSDGAFHLSMPRQDIADYLGLTIETVSRVFSKLKRENKIRLLSSSRVKILDPSTFANELLLNAA